MNRKNPFPMKTIEERKKNKEEEETIEMRSSEGKRTGPRRFHLKV